MKFAAKQSKYLITIHQPYLWVASIIILLLIISLIVWSAFEYGQHEAGFNKADYDQEIKLLRSSLNEQTGEKEKALRDNARLSRGSDIEKDASSKISDTLSECEDERVKMREELTFYQNIVTPRQSEREVKINKMTVTASADGVFNYKLVLIQIGKHDYVQRGYVELSFQGRDADGKEVRLDLPTVSVEKTTKQLKFGFKYFQNFEGGIRFPEGFEPTSLVIRAQPSGSKVPRVDEVYNWVDLIAGGSDANVGQE